MATASLELGIDIGPVELVCQIGSPRSFATFLQRVGRSNHTRTGTPAGRLYPTTRDELVECAALLRGVRAGPLDAIVVPRRPLDILAQQIVAESAAEQWRKTSCSAWPGGRRRSGTCPRGDFEDIAELLAEGIRTGRGRAHGYLHRDRVNGVKGRRGARLAALTSGGAIPELGDFRVVAEPDESRSAPSTRNGPSRAGRATCSCSAPTPGASAGWSRAPSGWSTRTARRPRCRTGKGRPRPHRELSEEVSALRQAVADAGARRGPGPGSSTSAGSAGPRPSIVGYLQAGLAALGALPTMNAIVLERFFDEAGGMQLVGHAPFGARVNRAFGLALRKRFCVTFDFELQAAASDDAICCRSARSTASRSTGCRDSWPPRRWNKWSGRPS